ncbi:MAG: response regulator [Sulfuricurvum sp.]|nr:response regulator [Sulfuricurvum sp.]
MFATQNLAVLYIEKDADIRRRGASLMHENGLKVFESSDTTNGCELFRMNEIDIVMIDLELPEKSGLNFIRCLRAKDVLTPVVITTDHSDKETLFEAINLDITRYLIKPCKKDDLLEALQTAIKKAVNCHPITYTKLHHGFSYDPINKAISNPEGISSQLTKKEYLFIELLLKNKNHIVPYDVIEMLVWEGNVMTMDALRTLVRGIRKKTYTDILSNHNGLGYKIDV